MRNLVLEMEFFDGIYEINNLKEIKRALNALLEVREEQLKHQIINIILKDLKEKFSDNSYKLSVNIAYDNSKTVGFVIAQINPFFRSYGKKCATFGWLRAQSLEICKKLMNTCEKFAIENYFRKIRGPINSPKGLGGIGAQIEGFNEELLYGVAFNPPTIPTFLDKLGYKRDAEYNCVYVSKKTWRQGKNLDENVRIGYLPLNEMVARKDEFLNLISGAFDFMLPDHSTNRAKDVINQLAAVPREYYKLPHNFNPRDYYNFPAVVEAWESCDLENVMIWAPLAFDRKTDELIGVIFCLPDLYQLWTGKRISRVNTDTAIVDPRYTGKGIFSSLNNLVQTTMGFFGVDYVEGCYIWNKNEKAVQSIFPHSKPIRKHIVFQKRLRAHKK
ncbi:hypothetical protein ES706_02751 [subsurface metagenome]